MVKLSVGEDDIKEVEYTGNYQHLYYESSGNHPSTPLTTQ